jgi:UDP-3-O-[3-hydroxymyristoyl] N-acetylglucosamine deacetylase
MTRRTFAREASASGVALHAGSPATVRLKPAAPGTGLLFRRADLPQSAFIPALWSNVAETRLGTVVAGNDGASIGVVEHLMSALSGAGIDDGIIEIDGSEPPILDGDALSFLKLVDAAGAAEQSGERPSLHVVKEVQVEAGNAHCRLLPSNTPEFHFIIDFDSPVIGRQTYELEFSPESFRAEIAPARTFGFLKEAEMLRRAGLARGADLTNTLVVDGDGLVNPHLRRFPDEFVRHKILDAIGDMKLAGMPLIARFEGVRSSHALNNALLRALFAEPANYEIRG